MSITPTKARGVFDLSCSTAKDFHHAGKGYMPFPTGERRVGALRMLELAPVRVTLYNAVRIRYTPLQGEQLTLGLMKCVTCSRSMGTMNCLPLPYKGTILVLDD